MRFIQRYRMLVGLSIGQLVNWSIGQFVVWSICRLVSGRSK
jgi:hypothetical protein